MKKSQKIILIALGVVLAVIASLMLIGRAALGSFDGSWKREATETAQLDHEGFKGIVIKDSWEAHIEQSNHFYVNISYPRSMKDRLGVRVIREELILGIDGLGVFSHGGPTAVVGMPSLEFLRIEGAAEVSIDGFKEKHIEIHTDGAADIEADNSSADLLDVSLAGLGSIDLSGMATVNANVQLSGAGEIKLNMNGGVLTGVLDGLGSIRYEGHVSDEQVELNGLGRITTED